ncbi:MAG TPA: AlpA family phage regulatory protein [Casimicrobiaceae bacterium]
MPIQLLMMKDVCVKLRRGKTQIYADIKAGRFPLPIRIGIGATRWKESDIDEWISKQPLAKSAPVLSGAHAPKTPLCERCRKRPATILNHKTPSKDDSPENVEKICELCAGKLMRQAAKKRGAKRRST